LCPGGAGFWLFFTPWPGGLFIPADFQVHTGSPGLSRGSDIIFGGSPSPCTSLLHTPHVKQGSSICHIILIYRCGHLASIHWMITKINARISGHRRGKI
jgi:hypothetical protein